MKAFDAVVLANGEFPTHPVPLGVLHAAPRVVACDGAVGAYPQANVVIGDGDSVPAVYHDRLVRVEEQDDNDLTKATRYCRQQGWRRLAYIACTGRRDDHTLANIALLMHYYRELGIDGRLYTDYGLFTPMQGDHTFMAVTGQQVSIFNFGCTRLVSEGLKWHSYAYRELWQGTLNEALADHFTLRGDGYYLVYQTYECK